jgi:hypothetical protein
VSEVIPLFGFYLQPAVGGRELGFRFWRELAEVPGLVAIKIAPFDRYRTIDVVRAVAEAVRGAVGGVAVERGKLAEARLNAIPWTRSCKTCKEKQG